MEIITKENWSHSAYLSNKLMALVTFGAELDESHQDEGSFKTRDIYFVTVLDMEKEGDEVYQREFDNLDTAIDEINKRYSGWEFSIRKAASGEGCGDCAAH